MAPSRGPSHTTPSSSATSAPTTTNNNNHNHNHSGDVAVDRQSQSSLALARRNLSYLISPHSPSAANNPPGFRMRALLNTLRYLGQFIIWRLVRWAKYAAVGAAVAAVGATAFGGMVSGVGWVLAPTGVVGGVGAAVVWGVGRWVAGGLERRVRGRGKGIKGKGLDGEGEDVWERERKREARLPPGREAERMPW